LADLVGAASGMNTRVEVMGSCIRFGAVSGDWGYGERRIGERERVCCCAVWRRNGWRKESYNVGVPTVLFLL